MIIWSSCFLSNLLYFISPSTYCQCDNTNFCWANKLNLLTCESNFSWVYLYLGSWVFNYFTWPTLLQGFREFCSHHQRLLFFSTDRPYYRPWSLISDSNALTHFISTSSSVLTHCFWPLVLWVFGRARSSHLWHCIKLWRAGWGRGYSDAITTSTKSCYFLPLKSRFSSL